MLTAQELITLIKAHNKLVSIKVRASMKRETLIKLIEDKGYKVDHKNKKIVDARKDRPRRPKITLKEAEDMLPKPKTALQKQKAQERKEEKAAEEKKKLRMAKKEAVEQSKKGEKKPVVKKPVVKKPTKKEDEVRPATKPKSTPKPKPKAKPVKSTTSNKEDEVRPARRARRQLPETKKTTGTKVEDKPENVKVKKKKTEAEKKANKEKVKRADDLYRLKISELRKYVDMYNERDDKEMTLKSKGQDKDQLVNKIVGYNIDKIFKIPIPAKKVKQTEEQKAVKKKQNQKKANEETKRRRPFLPYLKYIGELQRKYNAETKEKNYTNVEEVIKKMKEQLEEKLEEIEEKAEEKDIELDDEIYDDIETDIDNYYKELREKAKESNEK